MNTSFSALDYTIFIGYCALIIIIGLWVSRDKKGHVKDSSDYFLASKSLAWWAVGASLIASNISAEQVVGMSGQGFALGLAISTYEWMAAATLLVVGFFLLPIYLDKKIYTMPEFLTQRFNGSVRTTMAVFWLLVYVFVNIASVLYLGALSLNTVLGVPIYWGVGGLALFALVYSIYGGLKAVAMTDVIQVVVLIAGGIATTYLALDLVGKGDWLLGLETLRDMAPEHFSMILQPGEIMMDEVAVVDGTKVLIENNKDAYFDLPGLTVLIGGMWIVNISYWGFNQYITQRALASKSLEEARKGIVFAGFLKLLIPVIVVLPGIAAYVLMNGDPALLPQAPDAETANYFTNSVEAIRQGMFEIISDGDGGAQLKTGWLKPDKSYPALLALLPSGLKGLAFAALAAAIVSSLASMVNSTATIFTMDIYRNYINKNASETQLVTVGRIVAVVAFVLACFTTPALITLESAFQFIQKFTGLISPAVTAIFFFGLFWKRTTANAVLAAIISAIPLGFAVDFFFKWSYGTETGMPFLDRMGVVFLILSAIIIVGSLIDKKGYDPDKGVEIKSSYFKASTTFWVGSLLIIGILAALYTVFW